MTEINNAHLNNKVGPVMRAGEIAQAVCEAAIEDNPGKDIQIEDKVAYVRIQTDDELILRRETLEEMIGRDFEMRELEINLASFSGKIESDSDHVRFYFTKHM